MLEQRSSKPRIGSNVKYVEDYRGRRIVRYVTDSVENACVFSYSMRLVVDNKMDMMNVTPPPPPFGYATEVKDRNRSCYPNF